MGVPHLFKYLVENYPDIIIKGKSLSQSDHLFFDLNCLIHPCASKVINSLEKVSPGLKSYTNIETLIIKEVKKYLTELIEYVNPKQTIYIAIDGPAPRAKMHQQRQRRFKSAKYNRELANIKKSLKLDYDNWDTNAITPGTEFMSKINTEMKTFLTSISQASSKFSFAYSKPISSALIFGAISFSFPLNCSSMSFM